MKIRNLFVITLVSMLCIVNISLTCSATTSKISFSLENDNISVKTGESFSIHVKMSDADDLRQFSSVLEYDSSVFSLTGIEAGDAVTVSSKQTGNKADESGSSMNYVYVASGSSGNVGSSNGTVMIINFSVKESANSGRYIITLHGDPETTISYLSVSPFGTTTITTPGHYRIVGGGTTANPYDSMIFTVNVASSGNISDPQTSSYTAYLNTDATEIAPGGTYTADLYMKSDDALSAGEIDLAAANGKITNIALADGIGMTQVDDVSDGKTEAKISFDGNTASAKEGLKIATITVQAADSLTDGSSVELNISNAVAAKTGSTKDQTVTLGEDAKVAVPVITAANCSCESYAAGKYLVKYTGTVADGEVAKYGEEEMFWSPKYASWVYLTNSDVSQTLRDSRFSSVSGTKKDLTCTGDVNGNSVVNIVDAQVAYDIANSVYSDFTNPTMEQWLMADVNADSMVDASDARAIQCIVHGLTG